MDEWRTKGHLYHGLVMEEFKKAGLLQAIADIGAPADWPLTPEELDEAIGPRDFGTVNLVDAVMTAQVAKIARGLGLPDDESNLVGLKAVFDIKAPVDR